MSYTTCTRCNSSFWRESDQHWKHLCLDCWKESKKAKPVYSTGNRDTGKEDRLRADLSHWRVRATLAEAKLAAHTCTAQFDLATLKRIRNLCHPDRHGNSQSANDVSQLINRMIREASA